MISGIPDFARRYQSALRTHLALESPAGAKSARELGRQAQKAGLRTRDLARIHERVLVDELLPACPAGKRTSFLKRAGMFFATAITPDEEDRGTTRKAILQPHRVVAAISQRTVELAACNQELGLEIARRRTVEKTLRKKERHYALVLRQSERLQEQLRRLSRQILSAQENERKAISRELHDIVAQSLAGINVRLAALKTEAAVNTQGLDANIERTQKLVEDSVNIVHRFARELRPAVLDDLGLIPALHSFMKNFTERTGVHTSLTAFAGVEQLNMTRRTALFRVAQEALTNVARHAQASRVELSIQHTPKGICMQVADNGKSFHVQRMLLARGGKRLGLLGMRERLEMVGGDFEVESAPGQGTTVTARVPFSASVASRGKQPLGSNGMS
jgi:two-component system sensor histidine kinase DegS